MRVKILGKKWNLKFVPKLPTGILGECDPPHLKNKQIRILASTENLTRLDTLIHECLHAVDFEIKERTIAHAASDIARVLWTCGYRLPAE